MSEIITVKKLLKYYNQGKNNEVFALKGIDLVIKEGESIALIGVSGSGKSTLLHILGAMDKATDGEYYFDGVNVNSLSVDGMAKLRADKIGFVFQQYGLLADSTVEENMNLALCFLSDKTFAEKAKSDIGEVLKKLGIEELRKRKVRELSGGQKQRVAIARALIKNPALIIADEPTGALDRNTAKEISDVLFELVKAEGKTLIVATHDMSITERFDRVIHMENGLISN